MLLAYLAYHLRRAHAREMLVDLLWPEEAEEPGRHNLRNALSALRRQLEPPDLPAGTVLLTNRATVQLNPDLVTTDVGDFESALRRSTGTVSGTERVMLLSESITLYRDELLPGCYEDWCLMERERLAGLYVDALRKLMTESEQAGDVERAVAYARQATHADPLCEESHVDLMRLLSVAGQLSSALRQYRLLETVFARELSERPSARARAFGSHLERLSTAADPQSAETPPPAPPIRAARGSGQEALAGGEEEGGATQLERARFLYGAGLRAYGGNEPPAARTFVEESIQIFRDLGDRAGLAYSLCLLGSLIADGPDGLDEALPPCEAALEIFRELNNRTGIAYALLSLGRISYWQGQFAKARPILEEHLAILRQMPGKTNTSRALISLGDVASAEGDRETARRFYEESLRLAREARPDGLGWWLEELAEDCALQRPERAARLLASLAALREPGSSPGDHLEATHPQRTLSAIQEALGEDAFRAAWAAGQAMTAEQVIEVALSGR